MTFSKREMQLALGTVVVLLAFFGWGLLKPRYERWQSQRQALDQLKRQVVVHEVEIRDLPELRQQLDTLMADLPAHPEGANVVADMMRSIERHASASGLNVSGVFPDQEREDEARNLYEFSIRCNWDGELPQLAQFLYRLQSQGAVMDVRQMNVKPRRQQGYLEGKLIIDFAYRRVSPEELAVARAQAAPPAAAPGGLTVTPEPEPATEAPDVVVEPEAGQAPTNTISRGNEE